MDSRNGPMPEGGWDLVVLGDSFVEFGQDEEDTLTSTTCAFDGIETKESRGGWLWSLSISNELKTVRLITKTEGGVVLLL